MTTEPLVLAIDDEQGILRLIKLELSEQGFRVISADNGEDGVKMAEDQRPDIVLLDIIMPDMNGLEVMRRLRERTNVPIIMLTAKGGDEDKVKGLELGADDYLAKPFSPDELSARVRAVLRRANAAVNGDNVVRAGSIEIDLTSRLVKRNGEVVNLTRTEWMLLQHLASHPGRIMLNTELLAKVWGPEYRSDLQYLRVWVSRLRTKLEDNRNEPRIIRTFQGIGYMFDAPGGDAAEGAGEPAAGEGGSVSAAQE